MKLPLSVVVLHPSDKVRANLRAILELRGNTVLEAAGLDGLVKIFETETVNVVLTVRDNLFDGLMMEVSQPHGFKDRSIPLCVIDPNRLLQATEAVAKKMPPPTIH